MSFLKASLKVHSLVQNRIPTPYFVDMKNNCLFHNPLYYQKYHKAFRYSVVYTGPIALTITFFGLVWLIFNWNPQLDNYIIRVTLYLTVFLGMIIINHNNYVVVYNHNQTRYVATQICRIFQKDKLGQTSNYKVFQCTLSEIFAYLLSVSFLLVALVIFMGPFVFSIDPIQLVFGRHLVVKIL